MQAVGRLGSYISRGVYTVSGPFLPFGGAVDIVVVRQKDGSFKSSPWYVRFGKLHMVSKEKVKVHISVNGVEPDFYLYLNLKGEVVFNHGDTQEEQEGESIVEGESESTSDSDGVMPQGGGNNRHFKSISWNYDSMGNSKAEAKVVGRTRSRRSRILGLVSRSLRGGEGEDGDVNGVDSVERAEIAANLLELKWSTNLSFDHQLPRKDRKKTKGEALNNGLPLPPRNMKEESYSCSEQDATRSKPVSNEMRLASAGCGEVRFTTEEVLQPATLVLPEVKESEEVTKDFDIGRTQMEASVLQSQQRECSHSGMCAAGNVGDKPMFRKSHTVNIGRRDCSIKNVRQNTPTSEQLESLNLREGRNTITFSFSTAMGNQQVDAQIYLWKWNTRIVISDVDGTITRSDVLGQFMPLVGIDWSQTGVAHLFSDIKENGYQLLFLSARAISQAYHTRQFLCNLKQDGKVLPDGPVVISPDGLFPSLYREVIRRAPHEFKIACLEDIKALFPPDCNPFYAGFGNRDTDEVSYLKVGIPKGKIFIINPRGEIVVNSRCFDTHSYTSLHSLVNGMFPPTNSSEQEDFNSWNYWKLPETSSAIN
ncbi:phosphatidate phosphatase PAH2 isoform X1 [Vigna unguiculata]|uniref:phosphatidate phosphatase PAH2 isoform X1 n=1 Tax=Vigna unguiculata TaxID=3917 RepID=UPI001016A6F8|nr:phosphatidate phosphatase PAH2 isoform X1 [Vigna unguiculata]